MFERVHTNILPARQIDIRQFRSGPAAQTMRLIAQTAAFPVRENSSSIANAGAFSEAVAHELLFHDQPMAANANPGAATITLVDSTRFKRRAPAQIGRIEKFDIFTTVVSPPEPVVDLPPAANVCAMAAGPLASKDLIS